VQSALCLIPPGDLWPSMQEIRSVHDKSFLRWPPHVNVLYPFVPEHEFPVAAARAEQALRRMKPFTVSLASMSSFQHSKYSHTLWLKPEDGAAEKQEQAGARGEEEDAPLQQLYRLLLQAFPHCDDSIARFQRFVPHLSLGQWKTLEGPPIAQLEASWEKSSFLVSHVYLIARSGFHDPFRVVYAVPLGK
ncbi:hypothetical protein GUITHDRAFT_51502, partial [Guillardia theta CCMP2712]